MYESYAFINIGFQIGLHIDIQIELISMNRNEMTCRQVIERIGIARESILGNQTGASQVEIAGTLQNEVLESWRRLIDAGTTPDSIQHETLLPDYEDIKARNAEAISIASDVLNSSIQHDTNLFCVLAIFDAECRVLYAVARGASIIKFLNSRGTDSRRVGIFDNGSQELLSYEGLDYGEFAVGTSSWSICATTRKPFQLVNNEQFASAFAVQNQLISSIPILNPDGSTRYVVSYCHFLESSLLDTSYGTCTRADLDFLAVIADQIESRLSYFNPTIRSVAPSGNIKTPHGTILANENCIIEKMDGNARFILGIDKKEDTPETLYDAIPSKADFFAMLKSGGRYETQFKLQSDEQVTLSAESFTVAASMAGAFIVVRLFCSELSRMEEHARPNCQKDSFAAIVSVSKAMTKVKTLCKQFSSSRENVFIRGEGSTGKRLLAKAMHDSSRPQGPFIVLNASSIASELMLPSILGYEGGTIFPTRKEGSPGLLEMANHGTLFIDEVIDIPMPAQAALLRAIDESQTIRVGGTEPIPLDIRFIAASSHNPSDLIRKGKLARDFYHGLAVLEVDTPPLRERIADIKEIAIRFIESYCLKNNTPIPIIDNSLIEALEQYEWPGNIRQLQNAMIYAANVARAQNASSLQACHLPMAVVSEQKQGTPQSRFIDNSDESFNLSRIEEQTIIRAWNRTHGDVSKMTAMLGISLSTLNRRIKAYGLH